MLSTAITLMRLNPTCCLGIHILTSLPCAPMHFAFLPGVLSMSSYFMLQPGYWSARAALPPPSGDVQCQHPGTCCLSGDSLMVIEEYKYFRFPLVLPRCRLLVTAHVPRAGGVSSWPPMVPRTFVVSRLCWGLFAPAALWEGGRSLCDCGGPLTVHSFRGKGEGRHEGTRCAGVVVGHGHGWVLGAASHVIQVLGPALRWRVPSFRMGVCYDGL